MTEFVGRTGAHRVYSYPESPRGAGPANFARNFASGPATDTGISSTGTQVPWDAVDVGAAGVSVQITPRVTGILRITGVFTLHCQSEGDLEVQVQAQVNNVTQPLPASEFNTVVNGGDEAVPFLLEIKGLTVGTTVNIQMLLTATLEPGITLVAQSSTLEIQEVPAATG